LVTEQEQYNFSAIDKHSKPVHSLVKTFRHTILI